MRPWVMRHQVREDGEPDAHDHDSIPRLDALPRGRRPVVNDGCLHHAGAIHGSRPPTATGEDRGGGSAGRAARGDVHRARRRATASSALERFASELDPVVPPPEVDDEVCACVSRLARTLKPEYADALHEIDVRGVAVKDYAAAQGLTASNAGVRVFRARQALRSQVMASCGTCAEHGCMDCRCGKP